MEPTPSTQQDLNALSFLISASLNKPPTGKLWIPPLYAPASAIEVFEQHTEGQAARAGDIFKVVFAYENQDGEVVVRTNGKKIYNLSSEFAKENPLWNYLRGIWASDAVWWDRIGLPYNTYEMEMPLENYLNPQGGTALERAGWDPSSSSSKKDSNGFNVLPWVLGAVGFGVGGPIGAPAGFVIGQYLSKTPQEKLTRQEKIQELKNRTIPTGRGK
jgi:hypothetical protein